MTNAGVRAGIHKTVGNRIRVERKRTGLTQAQLAERIRMSPNYVAHLERGTRGASLETLQKVAEVLGISPASLVTPSSQDRTADAPARHLRSLAARLKGLDSGQRELILRLAETVERWGGSQKRSGGKKGTKS